MSDIVARVKLGEAIKLLEQINFCCENNYLDNGGIFLGNVLENDIKKFLAKYKQKPSLKGLTHNPIQPQRQTKPPDKEVVEPIPGPSANPDTKY